MPRVQTPKGRVKKIALTVFVVGILAVAAAFLASRFGLSTSTYRYDSPKITAPVRIAVLTDEHANAFGRENQRLLSLLEKQRPDIILVVGDALNSYSADSSYLIQLITAAKEIAPVYFSQGNHELSFLTQNGMTLATLAEEIRRAGGVYLDQSYEDVTVHGQRLRIGGLYDYTYNNTGVPNEQYAVKDSYVFLREYSDTDAFKIMLTHRPESYLTDAQDARWPINLAVCGHEHGGQVRLPVLGGFYSTHLGLFSPYVDGYHLVNGIPVVVSRGLGTYYSKRTPPRFYNVPEIVMIELS